MKLPGFVYKSPGRHPANGTTYNFMHVTTEAEYVAALADGWTEEIGTNPAEKPISNAAPTRAELEQKAREIGLKYHGKTGDAKLAQMIERAIGGQHVVD